VESYVAELLRIRDEGLRSAGHFDHGANVLPVLRHYAGLKDPAARARFQSALEQMLTSGDDETRKYAVTLCLGFYVFRDAI
jgi:hypothetical protein